jgi:hypothetical protein
MADANENLGICSQTLSDYTETNIFPKSILFK